MTPQVVLSVAGTDSGGAAGLAADLATFSAHGVHGACVVTAVTAQDTVGVHAVHRIPIDVVGAQLDAVLDDLPVAAAKTGMLGSVEVVELIAARLGGGTLVVDPVLVATSGAVLGDDSVARAYARHLLPVATVATPNLEEARVLAGVEAGPAELARRLADLGCAVVVTGGDQGGTDWLAVPGGAAMPLRHTLVATTNDHGTGCTFSAALAALLGAPTRGLRVGPGLPAPGAGLSEFLVSACLGAAAFTTRQLTKSTGWELGRGRGPIAHLASLHDRFEEIS